MTKINARLVALTQPLINLPASNAEGLLAYCARVSNPSNQLNDNVEGLLKYCLKNKHWSVFEMANAVVEVEAPRDITRQLLRHRSLNFQEFSQRYSDEIDFTERSYRGQDYKNRQASHDNLAGDILDLTSSLEKSLLDKVKAAYDALRSHGVAKECARVLLPEGLTMSRLYVSGTLRSWIHYLEVREGNGTQLEHQMLANKIRECLLPAFPTVLGMINV